MLVYVIPQKAHGKMELNADNLVEDCETKARVLHSLRLPRPLGSALISPLIMPSHACVSFGIVAAHDMCNKNISILGKSSCLPRRRVLLFSRLVLGGILGGDTKESRITQLLAGV